MRNKNSSLMLFPSSEKKDQTLGKERLVEMSQVKYFSIVAQVAFAIKGFVKGILETGGVMDKCVQMWTRKYGALGQTARVCFGVGQVCPDVDKELWRLEPDGSGKKGKEGRERRTRRPGRENGRKVGREDEMEGRERRRDGEENRGEERTDGRRPGLE
ncbi:hypothetical protein TNCV_1836951 [Trichonephila clavipes]|nr:hypothetical protein TNCV_1836951 [Trichonephila clavipes]